GQLKWATTLYTGDFDAGGNGLLFHHGITQSANKNIVIGDVVYKSNKRSSQFKITDGRLHFTSLDYNTGNITWESNYRYSQPSGDSTFVPDINFVSELPGGQFSFITSLYLNDPAQNTLIKKPVSVITDDRGVVQKIIAFHSTTAGDCKLVDVTIGSTVNEKNFLFQKDGTAIISSVTNDQTINWSKGYTGIYPPNCLAAGARGYGILSSDYRSLQYELLLTDADGNADCVETPADIIAEELFPVNDNNDPVVTSPQINTATDYRDYFVDYGYPLKVKEEYPLQQTTECEEQVACCKDYVDTFNIKNVRLCEGSIYTLPDNNIVKDSGTYYIIYKTEGGCDSISFYRVKTDKNLSAFTMGNDTCLSDQNSILLTATGGYGTYNWMGSISGDSSITIHTTGRYWVNVANVCGTKTDSIEVFDQCNFPVYMPDAFTPNGDNLNDYFGVSEQNKNRLIELKIYNRWGQLVFQTNTKDKKWDGTYKNRTITTDVFIYYLSMEGLSGAKITYKGKVLLVR
ncbi:MAG TPA: gliding motility-associated C-terminal domain-containing protein, partial [Chitinophagaceae bacterium]|nr:gliding motility-associated C-terminal domain-containing protein [Chitinophagaceae bacterium]